MRETAASTQTTRPKQDAKRLAGKRQDAQPAIQMALAEPAGFERLENTIVYRTLPIETRATLDVAILLRPSEYPTLEKVYHGLELRKRFGLRLADLRHYASALAAFARPLMAALTVAELLQALPRKFTAALGRANRLLVWSRLVQQVVDPNAKPLTATEFAKLAHMLRGTRPRTRPRNPPARPEDRKSAPGPTQLAPIIQQLYGLTLPVDDENGGKAKRTSSAGKPDT